MSSLVYFILIAFVALLTLILLIIVCFLISRVGKRKAKHTIKFTAAVGANMDTHNSNYDSSWLNGAFEAQLEGSPNAKKVPPRFEESPSPLPSFQRPVQSLDQSTTSALAVEQLMQRSFISSDELKSIASSTNGDNVKIVATRRDFV